MLALPPPPSAGGLRSAPVGTDGVNLTAEVDPHGADTHVYFEYGTTTVYGATVPAPPGVDIGSGFGGRQAVAHISGLQAGTTYHYATVASNPFGTVVSADATFTTREPEGPFSLPDGRAWEQVTGEKGNGEIQEGGTGQQVAPDGDAVSFTSTYVLPGSQAGAVSNAYVAFRDASGWHIKVPGPPNQTPPFIFLENPVRLFSSDLTQSVAVSGRNLTGDALPGANIYLHDNLTGSETLITRYLAGDGSMVGASADFSHIVFTGGRLTPDTPEGAGGLYDYSGGVLRNIGFLPGESTPTASGIETAPSPTFLRPVSEDGNRVFFTTEPAPGEAPQVFVRIDDARTVEVSSSQAANQDPEAAGQKASFVGASADGRYAFFTSNARLTTDAYTGSDPGTGEPKDQAPNLYRFDVDTGRLVDLSVAGGSSDKELGANVNGTVIVAADGESAYFVALGDLATGGRSGAPNLYRWQQGVGVTFLAALREGDILTQAEKYSDARVTADGSVFAFDSTTPLDPAYRKADPDAFYQSQIFRFSAVEGSFTCVSCSGLDGSFATALDEHRNSLSADGDRVFFLTSDPLVPRDINERADVYEWEDGSRHLISSGTDRFGSRFVEASPSGDDVFFTTNERLVPGDTDELADVYDARVGGGLPGPAGAAKPCDGEPCLPPAEPAASVGPIGSASFNGPADPRHRRHRKHSGKKHPRKKHHGKHRRQSHKRSHKAGKRG